MSQIRLISGALTVGFWTLMSRILGFVRDILIAAWLGTGPVAEAFLVAFALPNMFRRFFAEGAFNMAFVPMFSKKLEAGTGAPKFAADALAGLAFVVTIFTVLATIFMPWLVLAMASGFRGDERFDIAVTLGRIVFVYILFISLAALFSGVLNAAGRFVAAAAAPVLLNIILITTLIAAGSGFGASLIGDIEGGRVGTALSFGVVLAGIAQLALVWWAAGRAGFPLRLGLPRMTPELKRLAIIAAPAALAGGVVQVNLLIGRQVASFFDGAIAWLAYADRLYQLPLGVVGIAIGIVLLPDLSRRLQAGDTDGGQHALSRAAEMSMALAIPSAVALVVIPGSLVAVLFERGAFSDADTQATALACAIYGLGLPAFVLQKVYQPLFFAREDTRRPFYYAVIAMVVNAIIAVGLMSQLGYIAAAVGTSVAGWAMFFQLWRGSRAMGEAANLDTRALSRILRITLASLAMGAVLWLTEQRGVRSLLDGAGGADIIGLVVLCLTGMVSYFAIGVVLKAFTIGDLKAAFRK
ncbi:MAG: murein biosynthesis integral membrane protein MurJ [Paracoccaceae bacterium]|nr:murein biosynthesis integral membrane protein MurJ [Paracoccaceae bacterium]